jgi:riboflavin synthase
VFTGLVQAVGSIVRVDPFEIDAGGLDLSDVAVGDSICVQGVCLTATALRTRGFSADVSAETLRVSAGLEQPGKVNLEKALRVGDPLGGHLVTGHVDGVGELLRRNGSVFSFRAPDKLARFIASKGSICVDGVSLTVNAVSGDAFEVNLIPHTLEVTTLGRLQPGAKVNLEIDLIARYVERILARSEIVRSIGPDLLNPSAV